jgi:cytoplasmic iron level regulating protein YaaA (DUF328/UPF0246 family)
VLVLLPPSQGQTAPARGGPRKITSFAELDPVRETVLQALVQLCRADPDKARDVLGLSPRQAGEIARNAALDRAPAAAAAKVYTGVLYEALGFATLQPAAARKAKRDIAVFSALWGAVRLGDRIPAYRCPAGVSLPGVGPLNSLWRKHLPHIKGTGLVIDMRSGPYAAMGRLDGAVTLKVVQDGKVVSHFNKAVKGRLVRDLITCGAEPSSAGELAAVLRALGYTVGDLDINTLSIG